MLAGLRVLDCTDERGFLAGKILGDLGADVIKLEPPEGDPVRRRSAHAGDAADPERSIPWLALNTSKRGITLDLSRASGRSLFDRLLSRCDVLLESYAPGFLDGLGLGFESQHRTHPRLVHCAITPFGQRGPRAGELGSDLTIVARGGNMILTGHPDRPPVRCTMPTSHFHAAPEAALGVLFAIHARERTGRGQFVDVSMQECQLATLMTAPGQYALDGRLGRRSGGHIGRTREIWPAKDGWVSFGLRGGPSRIPGLRAMVAYMDECGMAPEWLRDYDWEAYDPYAADEAELARIEDAMGTFFRSRTLRALYDEALRRRILLAPCNDAREILDHPQLRDRELFTPLALPGGDEAEHPARFARASSRRLAPSRRAPRLGEHNAEVYGELGLDEGALEQLRIEGAI